MPQHCRLLWLPENITTAEKYPLSGDEIFLLRNRLTAADTQL
jgi:hypothetical protein